MKLNVYGKMTTLERIALVAVNVIMPLYICARVILSPFTQDKRKSVSQIMVQSGIRFSVDYLSDPQMQWLSGTDTSAYRAWAAEAGRETREEEIHDGAKLMWIGPKSTKKVLLFVHGGAFLFPILSSNLNYLDCVKRDFESRGITLGVVALAYNLGPEAGFPAQLRDAKAGIDSLLDSGIRAEDILLVGDSAGANLILQVLSHLVRPLHSVKTFRPNLRLGGVCLISPWVSLEGDARYRSFTENSSKDVASSRAVRRWGRIYMSTVPVSDTPYADPTRGDDKWFEGLHMVVNRILVTAGEHETICSAIHDLFERYLDPVHNNARLVVEKEGLHDQLFQEFVRKEREEYSEVYSQILEWYFEAFEHAS